MAAFRDSPLVGFISPGTYKCLLNCCSGSVGFASALIKVSGVVVQMILVIGPKVEINSINYTYTSTFIQSKGQIPKTMPQPEIAKI